VIGETLITTAALSLIIGLRYLAIAGGAYWLFWGAAAKRKAGAVAGRLNRQPPRPDKVRHEVLASLIATPIYALPAAAVLVGWKHGFTKLYLAPDAYGWAWLPVSALIYLLAHDAFYYWLHRAMHDRRVFAWTHRGHHLSHDPSPFASFSFDPAEAAMTAWFLPALTLFIPIQVYVALGLLMLMTITAVLNHAGREIWPARWLQHPVGRMIITARHHDAHHKRFTCNYGLYFRFWDRIAGTDRD
jgi:sterol desaturase/sphingolipid hydroxylase (fatty acid hydroxylase superfamily)